MSYKTFRYPLGLGLLLVSMVAHAYPACTLSASEIGKKIHSDSTEHINYWLYANNSDAITKLQYCVVTGEKPWLDIANALLTASPEDSDDELMLAVSAALDSNPANVLAEHWSFGLDLICADGADIYDSPYASYEVAINHSNSRIKKIEEVKQAELQANVQACVNSLKENQKWIAHLYGKDGAR